MRCMNVCPKRVVQAWCFHLVPIAWGLLTLGAWIWPMGELVWFTILTGAVFPLYWLMHQLWRVRIVNAAFTWTTPTRYWGRYLARGIRLRDLNARRGAAGDSKELPQEGSED